MRLRWSKPSPRALKRMAWSTLLLTSLYAFIGFLILPLMVRPLLTWQLREALRRPVSLEKLSLNPFTLSLTIRKLQVGDILPYRPLFTCDEILVNLELASLIRLGLVLKEVSLTAPHLSVIRIKGSDSNLADLLADQGQAGGRAVSPSPFPFAIETLSVHQGRVDLSDLTVNREQVVEAIEIALHHLSTLARDRERSLTPRVRARVNGASFALEGQMKPFTPSADNRIQFTLAGSNLTDLTPYLPKRLGIDLTAGRADSELSLAYQTGPDSRISVTGSLALTALEVVEKEGEPLLSLPGLTVTLAPSLPLHGEIHLAKVVVERPVVNLRRKSDRTTNLDLLLSGPQGPPQAEVEQGAALQLTIAELSLAGGRISLQDLTTAGPFQTVLEPVDLSLSGLTTKGEGWVDYSLTLSSEAGEGLTLEGSGTLSPLLSAGDLALTGITLPKYRPYFADRLDFTLAAGSLDLESAFQLAGGGSGPELTLSELALALRDLSCRRGEETPFLTIPSLSLEQGGVDLAGRTLQLAKVRSQGGHLAGKRAADGAIDLASLLRQAEDADEAPANAIPWRIELGAFDLLDYALDFTDLAPPEPLSLRIGRLALHGKGLNSGQGGATLGRLDLDLGELALGKAEEAPLLTIPALAVEGVAVDQPRHTVDIARIQTRGGHLACQRQKDGTLDLATLLGPTSPGEARAAGAPAWELGLGRLEVEGYGVAFSDQVPVKPFVTTFDQISLAVQELRNRPESQARVEGSLVMNDQGRLTLKGQMGHDPLTADLQVTTAAIPLAAFAPYWGERVRLAVSKGAIASEGRVVLQAKSEGPPEIRYEGGASLTDFAALDNRQGKLLEWNSLTAGGIDLTTTPLQLKIKEVGLTDYFLSLVLSPEGTLNLRDLAVEVEKEKRGTPPAQGPEKASLKTIDIGRVTLQGGEIAFSDHSITPNFSTRLLAVTGRVSGLRNDQASRAEVDLLAKLANRAPIAIQGTINPLAEELFVDLKGSVKDVELSSLTPYSGRYVGYTIRKGKLFLDTSYSIIGTRIDSQHAFLLDQFLLGDQVESREAIKAPIKLAVALLKNRKGEIHLDLPIKGDLSRPDFQMGAIAAKVFVGLITKAVTAPFALLGAMFGGEELRFAEFAPGNTTILPETQKRLDALAQALFDRPGLNLEIKGYAAQDKDHEALVRQRFAELLVAGGEGEAVSPEKALSLVTAMTPKEREKNLAQAYKRADFPKPRNALGFAKWLEPEEMEKLLISHIEVSHDDLLALADERAQVVLDALLASNKVERERFFLLEPGVEPARGEGKLAGSRVDFSLR